MQPALTDISLKSTKGEILQAYEKLLDEQKKLGVLPTTKKDEVQKAEERTVVEKVSLFTLENVLKNAAELKVTMSNALDNLVNRLTDEVKKFSEVQKAIEVGKRQLTELHNLEIGAETLALIINDVEQNKKAFAEEMATKEKEWAQRKEEQERSIKEEMERRKKEREREEEEYTYERDQNRLKEEDAYELAVEEKKRKWGEEVRKREEELKIREIEMAKREEEFQKLKAEAEGFPAKLEQAVALARKEAGEYAAREAEIQAKLTAKDVVGERTLLQAQLSHAQEIIERQSQQAESLRRQLAEATAKAQELATKVIEGASSAQTLQAFKEGFAGKEKKGEEK